MYARTKEEWEKWSLCEEKTSLERIEPRFVRISTAKSEVTKTLTVSFWNWRVDTVERGVTSSVRAASVMAS